MENLDLLTESYFYDLDPKFIADRPVPKRDNSKLLVYDQTKDKVIHTTFKELPKYLAADDLLVLNESKVFPCRMHGNKSSGGVVELFLLSLIPESGFYPAMIRANGKKRIGDLYDFGELKVKLEQRSDEGDFLVSFNMDHKSLLSFLNEQAQIPIPPYIRDGVADEKDIEDYQTVYAKNIGSVAAPTAGLHFTQNVFSELAKNNIHKAFVNLHVGAGTFKPVSVNKITEHIMHKEYFDITDANIKLINKYKNRIAVGTTSFDSFNSPFH
jgi:S-adenosylmethionine:tRNA ribosyltransferase-isomerase